jgi:hypothetical protein
VGQERIKMVKKEVHKTKSPCEHNKLVEFDKSLSKYIAKIPINNNNNNMPKYQ